MYYYLFWNCVASQSFFHQTILLMDLLQPDHSLSPPPNSYFISSFTLQISIPLSAYTPTLLIIPQSHFSAFKHHSDNYFPINSLKPFIFSGTVLHSFISAFAFEVPNLNLLLASPRTSHHSSFLFFFLLQNQNYAQLLSNLFHPSSANYFCTFI